MSRSKVVGGGTVFAAGAKGPVTDQRSCWWIGVKVSGGRLEKNGKTRRPRRR